jgi:signal transduction histidine kinase
LWLATVVRAGGVQEDRVMAASRPVVPAVAALLALLFLFGVAAPEGVTTTYGAASDAAAITGRAAGLALLVAGALVFLDGRASGAGALALAAGLVWWTPDVVGWEGGSALARSIAAVLAPFFLPLVIHLAVRRPRALVIGAYAAAAVTSLGIALVRDPLEDLDCWRNCTDNVFLVSAHHDLATALTRVWLGAAVALGAALAVLAAARLRRGFRPLLAAAVLAGLAEAAYAAALLIEPAEDPRRTGFAALYLARGGAAIALAAGLAWTGLEARRRHAAVTRLSAQLGETPRPGTLAAVLARSLGDPRLQVGYWLPGERRHVDADGRAIELPAPGARAITRIARGAEPVAVVVHDPALLDGPALEREIGAAARLAVDNERLQAAVLAQLADLRASRARIVESADAERRRLERDLHDGAQQRLLALTYELRIARAKAGEDRELAALLGAAVDRANDALADLRELAHGIYPAILSEAGLAPALDTIADTAPIAVEIGEVTAERHPSAVEAAAYVAVAWAIEDAVARSATFAGVSVRNGGTRLVVEVGDDGDPRGAPALYVADRVAALDGRLDCAAGLLTVELPCA